MNFFKTAASAATAAAKMAADSAKKTYAELKAPPSKVRCIGCPMEIEVPPSAFDWNCPSGHINKRSDDLCTVCKVAQPAGLSDPTVQCPTCQTVTVVPLSNAAKHAREAAVKTKEFAVQTAAATKSSIQHLKSAPTTFHCAHCNSLLAVPTGPWACQTCTVENVEESKTCKQCGQKKTDQKAICGVCRQSTAIPATNFEDSFKHTVKEITVSSRKVYYDLSGKPYLTCGKCGTANHIDRSKVSNAAGAAAASPQPAAAAGPDGAAPGGLSSPPPSVQAEGAVFISNEVVLCTGCKNPIEQ